MCPPSELVPKLKPSIIISRGEHLLITEREDCMIVVTLYSSHDVPPHHSGNTPDVHLKDTLICMQQVLVVN